MPLYLVRHGQTDWNVAKRFQARTDIPLNDTGRAQARAVRVALARRHVSFSQVWSSPLVRARETASLVLADALVAPIFDERLLEISLGDYEGRSEVELHEALGTDFETWRARRFLDPAPGGESLEQAIVRVQSLVDLVRSTSDSENTMFVAHQAILIACKAYIAGTRKVTDLQDFAQRNDEVDVWDLTGGRRLEQFFVTGEEH